MHMGIGVSSGFSIGNVVLLKKEALIVPQHRAADVDAEMAAFEATLAAVIAETQALYEKALTEMGASEAEIFEAHKMILEDSEMTDPIRDSIRSDGDNAAWAIEKNMNGVIELFTAMEDDYMRERAADMRDIKERLLRSVLGLRCTDISKLNEGTVIAAYDLTPSDTAKMDSKHVVGIVTEVGGRTSHTAIMARTLEIPAVVGISGLLASVVDGDEIALNGDTGEVFVHPDEGQKAAFYALREAFIAKKKELAGLIGQPSATADGRSVELAANIGTPDDLTRVLENDAEGIGLFRSEFLYMDRKNLPTEDEQFEAYKSVVSGMSNKPVIVRTLDIGGDKELPALKLHKEENPFLGYRAIRLCLDRVDLFKVQLRALLRASMFGKLRIMFPMISSIGELRHAKAILGEAMAELREKGIPFDEHIEVGIMVEIPSTAVLADLFAKECDFFSIGTNDLIQYTVAVDRGNEKIAPLYSQYHPAVLRLIAMTIEAAHANGIFCGMCGEAAGDVLLIPALIGLGLDEFSMSASSILPAREVIGKLNYENTRSMAKELLQMATADEVKAALSGYIE